MSARAADSSKANTIYSQNDLELILKTQRARLPRFPQILDALGLKDGMTVVDIGAGTGQLTYAIAERLHGTGKVYATDIDPMLVNYVAAQAREQKHANLEAVLVTPVGLDEFYTKHKFDLVLLYNTDTYIRNRVAYYKKLRESLNPSGRIVIIESESTPNRSFYVEDVKDWNGLVKSLKDEPIDTPYGKHFRRSLGPLLTQYSADDPFLKRMIVFHLNRILDVKFFADLTDKLEFKDGLAFTEEERPIAVWMLHRLALDGVLDRDLSEIDIRRYRQMQLLNKLLLIQKYRPFLSSTGQSPYYSLSPESVWYTRHDYRVRELTNAGFSLSSKHPLVPFWQIWTFEPSARPDESRPSGE